MDREGVILSKNFSCVIKRYTSHDVHLQKREYHDAVKEFPLEEN